VLERTRTYLAGFDGPRDHPWPPAQRPPLPTDEWRKGFLAGLFDADGQGIARLRIVNSDPHVIECAQSALTALGFRFVVEPPPPSSTAASVTLQGGLSERLRFFHTVDPADTRKRGITGVTVDSDPGLDVVSVTPLGLTLPMFDITTGTGDFIANGVVSHNCFARNTHTYLDLDAGHDFDSKVIVKVNAPELLRKELSAAKWTGAHIAMGTNVDCYQRAEGKYGLMRGIIGALRDFANPFSILTKGTLITRDLDLLRQAAEVTSVGVSFSVGFVDEDVWRSVEPGTPSPLRRLDAVRRFADAGFAVHVLMAPLLPGITDTDESIEATVAAIAASGAAGISPISLHLRPGAREWYAAWLGRTHPELVDRYRSLYGNGSYSPKAYQREVSARVAMAARRHGIGRAQMTEHRAIESPHHEAATTPTAEQLTLL
jgi:DNA repair photolyase